MLPVAEMEQLVPEITQVAGDAGVTTPVPAVWEKAIFSPEIVPEAPDTVAVQSVLEPTATEAGAQETVVVVVDARDGAYWKVVVIIATLPPPDQVAFTLYAPVIQFGVPPAVILWL